MTCSRPNEWSKTNRLIRHDDSKSDFSLSWCWQCLSAEVTIVTYTEHMTWSRAGYVQSLSLVLAVRASFLQIICAIELKQLRLYALQLFSMFGSNLLPFLFYTARIGADRTHQKIRLFVGNIRAANLSSLWLCDSYISRIWDWVRAKYQNFNDLLITLTAFNSHISVYIPGIHSWSTPTKLGALWSQTGSWSLFLLAAAGSGFKSTWVCTTAIYIFSIIIVTCIFAKGKTKCTNKHSLTAVSGFTFSLHSVCFK